MSQLQSEQQYVQPCPLCGADAVKAFENFGECNQKLMAVGCNKCCLWISTLPFSVADQAITNWNRRPKPVMLVPVRVDTPPPFIASVDDAKLQPSRN